jgi:NAD-dependent deacetylase
MNIPIATVAGWVGAASSIVALTGAGISTESGIPDFRGPHGVWTRDPKAERLSNIHEYMTDPEVRKAAWQGRLNHPAWQARPNAGHRALVSLERHGTLRAVVTQNIDGLHQAAGHDAARIIEVHGTMRDVMCMGCGWRGPAGPVIDRVRAGEADPPCLSCGGILKSATISFGQALVPEVIDAAFQVARQADLLLAVGTSLQVYPVAGLVPLAKSSGARVVIVNAEATQFDSLADAVIRAPIGDMLPQICAERDPVGRG